MGLRFELTVRKTVRMRERERDALAGLVEDGEFRNESEAIRAGVRKLLDAHGR